MDDAKRRDSEFRGEFPFIRRMTNWSPDIRDSLWTGQGIDEEPFTRGTRALIHTSASRHTVVPFLCL